MNSFTINSEDSMVLIIDVQEKMLPSMANSEQVLKNSNVILQAAKAFKMPVFVTEQYPKGLGPTVSNLKTTLDEINAIYSDKTAFNAITPTIENALKNFPIKDKPKVIIAGIEAHICVFQSVRTLLDKGYQVFIPEDAVSSRDINNKNRALKLFTQMGAVVTNTESILFDLLGDSKNPHFKELQALIK